MEMILNGRGDIARRHARNWASTTDHFSWSGLIVTTVAAAAAASLSAATVIVAGGTSIVPSTYVMSRWAERFADAVVNQDGKFESFNFSGVREWRFFIKSFNPVGRSSSGSVVFTMVR